MRAASTIQRSIARLIDGCWAEQPDAKFVGDVVLIQRGQKRCPLVNPLCPSDLCVLPAGHDGTEEGYHVLGTDNYTLAQRYIAARSLFIMMPVGTTDEALIERGWEIQHEHWPEDET